MSRGLAGATSMRPPWPACGVGAGRRASVSAKPAWRRCPQPCERHPGKVVAAVSVSGPLERMTRQPSRMHAPAVMAAADRLSESLRRTADGPDRWPSARLPEQRALAARRLEVEQ